LFFLTARPRSRLQTPEGLARLKAEAAGRRAAKTRGSQNGVRSVVRGTPLAWRIGRQTGLGTEICVRFKVVHPKKTGPFTMYTVPS
jgi:hypothetical protein